eukprot:CAMPEP_0115096636 /NCGR_PEP_ID=MMETSP0227-20121206/29857_1 /TAXON_ID=89957 /ORGANISM="Polarella glacialis, Strain CCMP 1383" /LENGTH=1227 /DNA_ID=CAMNT_0002490439 /DNA_START=52 /DNA_END=3735 /DNA_ORIENTATION=-
MAKTVAWDFEPRNVTFKVSLRAQFHPSIGSATVSIPWLDAAGALGPSVSIGPLNTCEADSSGANPSRKGASQVQAEKTLGSFPVTMAFVRGIQNGVLPLTVSLSEGGKKVASGAKIFLGPLLLAGGSALCPETLRPGELARSKRLRPSPTFSAASATWTDTVGVAGLYRLEVSVSTDIPILSEPMLQRLMPACFKIEAVRGLPNERWLPEQCEDVFVEVYPKLSSASEPLSSECQKLRSASRPHNKTATFDEPMVWLLGLVPAHAMREWLQHEGIVVEVHDRDPQAKRKAEGADDAEDEKAIHGHGVARFPLGPLLRSETLELALRADVFPNRGDKKRRRAEAMSRDALGASGLLEEDGKAKIERRAGLDKCEDTTNYHSAGTVCTLRAALAVPMPAHLLIQEKEEGAHAAQWETTEQKEAEGNVWVAKSMHTREETKEGSESPTKWAPKVSPFRAKVGDAVGPWRKTREEAAQDEQKMAQAAEEHPDAAADAAEASLAASRELHAAVPVGAKTGLDCRYERYGRIVISSTEGTDGEHIRAVLNTFRDLNAEILGLDPKGGEFLVRLLSESEQADPHLDLLTGFGLLDGRTRTFVIEGLRDGHSMSRLLEAVPRGPDAPKLLYNPNIGFGERLYASFGPQLKQIKVRQTLDKLSSRPGLYSWSASASDVDRSGNEAPKQLMDLKLMSRMRAVRQTDHFPKAAQMMQLQLLYGAYISDEELEGLPPVPPPARIAKGRNFLQSAAAVDPSSDKAVILQQAITSDTIAPEGAKTRNRTMRNVALDQQNPHFENKKELEKSASQPDFIRVNRTLVHSQSETNVRMNDLMGKKRERETPFLLEGQEVYLYSSQKLNSAELQKEWLRQHMEGHEDKQLYTYSPTYLSQSFEFAGGAPPGVQQHQPSCPNDTYARQQGDERPIFRLVQSRDPEAFRKPARDLDQFRSDWLKEPFEENEWHGLAVGDSRGRPKAIHCSFSMDKVPHQRRFTERPFDSQHLLMKDGLVFGQESDFESVHYHGRNPGETRGDEAHQNNLRSREAAEKKIRAGKHMRTWDKHANRSGVSDLDRSERILKDPPAVAYKGRLDARAPETMRTMETFHEIGRPDLEWHARLRENDASPPFDVQTGAHIKRDHEVGTGVKRSCMSGKLTSAPWRHEGTQTLALNATNPQRSKATSGYHHTPGNFNNTSRPPGSRLVETHLCKSASRTAIASNERSQDPYLRPHHYGVQLSAS